MAWKDVPAGSAMSNRLWVNEGLPGERTSISVLRGMHVNIPTINGGIGTILNYDSNNSVKLNDSILTTDVVYSGQYYTYTDTGDSVGVELNNTSQISSLDIYMNGHTDSVLLANTLHIMSSEDGITWSRVESFTTAQLSYINESTYAVITINLTQPISTKFIAIRTTSDFTVNAAGNRSVRTREFRVLTPVNIGVNGDTYIHRNTGDVYEKINNIWVRVYTAPEIPKHLVGESVIPPSGAGIPIGSFYIVKPMG